MVKKNSINIPKTYKKELKNLICKNSVKADRVKAVKL